MPFVPHATRDAYLLNNIPADIREAWSQEANERDTSLTNVLAELLASRYRLSFEGSDRPLKSDASLGATFKLSLPPAVMDAVRDEAHVRNVSMRAILLVSLAEHFNLEPPNVTKVDPERRPGRPRSKHGRPKGRKGTPA